MRVAIILPWIGGAVPSHLSFTCHTMVGGLKTATLLLVHEAAQRLSLPRSCQLSANVKVEELRDGGMAALHASAFSREWECGLQSWAKKPKENWNAFSN